jgi:hypothetical protein
MQNAEVRDLARITEAADRRRRSRSYSESAPTATAASTSTRHSDRPGFTTVDSDDIVCEDEVAVKEEIDELVESQTPGRPHSAASTSSRALTPSASGTFKQPASQPSRVVIYKPRGEVVKATGEKMVRQNAKAKENRTP